jgi:hypothetical protein
MGSAASHDDDSGTRITTTRRCWSRLIVAYGVYCAMLSCYTARLKQVSCCFISLLHLDLLHTMHCAVIILYLLKSFLPLASRFEESYIQYSHSQNRLLDVCVSHKEQNCVSCQKCHNSYCLIRRSRDGRLHGPSSIID